VTDFQLSGARVLVTGAAGFLGSHLCERLLREGASVLAMDNFLTGRIENVADLVGHGDLTLIEYDVTNFLAVPGSLDAVLHFASPASPVDYLRYPIQTLKVGALGTHKALGLARAKNARFMLASTSEVYGDPEVHPQPEDYWGRVNPVGPRGVYDEAKRFGEAMAFAYHRTHDVAIRVPRIFNTYGPRMRMDDGRAVPTLISQAMAGDPMTIHGDGTQTRSLCFIDDTIDGFIRLLLSDMTGPVNLGSPFEVSILELAGLIMDAVGKQVPLVHEPRPEDDPQVRRPDTRLAERELGWHAQVPLDEGLRRTVEWFRTVA
jgi:dTDP-glucose 4,6-dehydratase